MSISNLLRTGRNGVLANQAAMNTTGQNIANVNTEGYARRRVTMSPLSTTDRGLFHGASRAGQGAGVTIDDFSRLRDEMTQRASWEAQSGYGFGQEEARLMGALEAVFPQGPGSFDNVLDDFWNGWGDLADNPLDEGVRTTLLSRAEALTGTFNKVDKEMTRYREQATDALRGGVDTVNGLLDDIAELNEQIRTAETNGTEDFAAEDERDTLIRELGAFGPVRVHQDGNRLSLKLGGMTVVDDTTTVPLQVDDTTTPPTLSFDDTGVNYTDRSRTSGKLGAWMRSVEVVEEHRAVLDDMAAGLARAVNDVHTDGEGLDGAVGDFFEDPGSITAGTLKLDANVAGSPRNIAASADGTPGNSDIALDIGRLRTADVTASGKTAEGALTDLVSSIGSRANQATQFAEQQRGVIDYLDSVEEGTSGVNMDEEVTNLIKYQQSYAASARIIDTAQQMFDTLLSL